jgi:hypothetical protein
VKLFVASFIAATTLCASGYCQETSPVNQKLIELSAASLKAKEACEQFKNNVAALLARPDTGDPLLKSGRTVELYQMVDAYPGVPQEYLDANRLIRETLDEGTVPDLDPVTALYPCEPSSLLDAAQKLANDSLDLNANDQAKTTTVLLAKIDHELGDTPSLLSTMVQLTLINLLIDKGYLEASDPVFIELTHTREEAEQVRREIEAEWRKLKKRPTRFKTLSANERKAYASVLTKELDQSQRFAHRLTRLLTRVSRPEQPAQN